MLTAIGRLMARYGTRNRLPYVLTDESGMPLTDDSGTLLFIL